MYLSNIDTMMFSLDFSDYDNKILTYRNLLDEKKQLAQTYRANFSNEKAIININDLNFEVLANGSMGYAYILHNSDYEIDFSMARSSQKDNYPVFVRIKQNPLWSNGIYYAYGFIIHWLQKIFGTVSSEKLNRIDICCHTDCIPFQNFGLDFFKTRSTKKNIRVYGNTINGFEFGSRKESLIYCRIYNKTLEVKESKKATWFFDIWKKNDADISNIWNIEFELKRNFFREYNIESFADFINNAKSIWDYLTTQWLILCIKDHSRLENCTIHPAWSAVAEHFFIEKYAKFTRKSKQFTADRESLVAQIIGYIRSYAAIENISDLHASLERLYTDITIQLSNKNKSFEQLVREKSVLYVRG